MNFFYIFLNSVAAPTCYWYEWSNWEQPLTCGEVCKHRKRDICMVSLTNWCNPLALESNYYPNECPWDETQTHSCKSITCRELIF